MPYLHVSSIIKGQEPELRKSSKKPHKHNIIKSCKLYSAKLVKFLIFSSSAFKIQGSNSIAGNFGEVFNLAN